MTIYEQVENIMNDAKMALDEKLCYQKSRDMINNPIDISKYTMDLRVAMVTILSLGHFNEDEAILILPHPNECITRYLEMYSRVLHGERFYIEIFNSYGLKTGKTQIIVGD